jgi:hypothetical protein
MTREDILKMGPGRELDIQVAIIVFGDLTKTKPFSIDISATEGVINKMLSLGWLFRLEGAPKEKFVALFYHLKDWNKTLLCGEGSLSEAIIKAALIAKLSEPE